MPEAVYLGVTITESLSWKTHIKKTANKATEVLQFLWRNLKQCSESVKEKAYLTLSRPLLEYASAAWDPSYRCDIDVLEMVQRRASRFVKNVFSRQASVTALLETLGWPSLERRRQCSRLLNLYKARTQRSGLQVPPHVKISPRDDTKYIQTRCKTNIYSHSFFPRTIKEWNALGQRAFGDTDTLRAFLGLTE